MQVVWTRRQDQWDRDRALFTRLSPIHIPLTRLESLRPQLPNLAGSTILVSSVYGAQLLIDFYEKDIRKAKPAVETFSSKVAQRLKMFDVKQWPFSSMTDFVEHRWQDWQRSHKRIIFLGAESPAFPIREFLEEKGVTINKIDLYRTINLDQSGEALEGLLKKEAIFCLASPSAALALKSSLRDCLKSQSSRIADDVTTQGWSYLCIGQTTGSRCRQIFGKATVIEHPDLSLLARRAEDMALKTLDGI